MSGKAARRLRKKHAVPKKTLAFCAGLCLSSAPLIPESQFLVSVFPHLSKPLGEAHSIEYGLGAGAKLTYRPVKNLNIFAQGDYYSLALPGVDPINLMQGSLGTGFHVNVSDRVALDFNINAGVYNAKSSSSVTGISAGGSIVFTYRISPSISVDVDASATHYAAGKKPLMMVNAAASPGVTFNITEFFNSTSKVDIKTKSLAPVFPVLYSWYENNSFGTVDIINNEDGAITNVTVSFFQPQYMAHAKECAEFKKIKKGQSVSVDLLAFFNEQMLELREKTDTNSVVIVNYSYLGQKRSKTVPLVVPVYGRNNMSWDDDRRAAVFVSSKDPAAMQFAKYTTSIVRENLHTDIPVNIQYAMGIFETLNQFGLNYVVDPSSAFEDNVGTSSIDFLQFPYQTLMYRGGDCDDISILVCSLFEAAGIDTAFITIPGHIFMAFNAGITPEQARLSFRNISDVIIDGDEVWVPLEITLSDEGFYRACRVGAREWNTAAANGTAALYKMRDSWKLYQPISVPGANAYFSIPDNETIYLAFEQSAREWGKAELKPALMGNTIQYVMKETDEQEITEAVIKEDPLSPASLNDIISLASNVAAVTPAAIREEELEDKDDSDSDVSEAPKGSDEDESIDDILPLDFAIATVQTDVPLKIREILEEEAQKEDVSNLTFEERLAKAELRNSRTAPVDLSVSAAKTESKPEAVAETPVVAETITVAEAADVAEAPAVAEPHEKAAEPAAVHEPAKQVEPAKQTEAVAEAAPAPVPAPAEPAQPVEPAPAVIHEPAAEPVEVAAVEEPAPAEEAPAAAAEPVKPAEAIAKEPAAKPATTDKPAPTANPSKQSSNTAAIAVTATTVTALAVAAGLVINARKKKREEDE